MPVMVMHTWELLTLGHCPTGGTGKATDLPENPVAHHEGCEYLPELRSEPARKDLKPLTVHQSEGPSFKVTDENHIEWQKWKLRLGWNVSRQARTSFFSQADIRVAPRRRHLTKRDL